MISESIKIFFSLASAPQDRTLFAELRKHLNLLRQQGLIEIWHDSMISAGSDFSDIVQSLMRKTDIIILLISADFFDSQQCVDVEMPCALEQHALRATLVIPVLLRPTLWQGLPLARYTPLPESGKPVSVWSNRESALTEVAKGIQRVVKEIASRFSGVRRVVQSPQFPLYMLPYGRNPFFTDRKDILSELQHFFASEQAPQTRVQALYGLAGIGKTLLAIEYACRHQHEYQAVLWLNATSPELLSSNILSLADQLGILLPDDAEEQQRLAALQEWLRRHDRWLLVLDNLDDFATMDRLIPLYSSGHVLLITLSQATGPLASAIAVTPLTVEESALLLLRRAKLIPEQGSRADASEADFLQAMAIAQEVEGYPLALDQAGAYIEETRQPPAQYLKRYHGREATLLGRRGQFASDHPDPVTTTLALTFKKIAQIDPRL